LSITEQPLFIGQNFIHFEEIDSTNAYAQLLVSKSSPSEGTVISTSFQLEGRGQIGRSWHSSEGMNLLFSIILYPKFLKAKDQFLLNMAISCAIREFVQSYLPKKTISIKWPNDIYIGNEKVAGLLIQNIIKGDTIASSVIGLGININEINFPSNLPNPTSLKLQSNVTYKLHHLRKSVFRCIENYYLTLQSLKVLTLRSEYIQHLYLRDEPAQYVTELGDKITGIIKHVDDSGRLIMQVGGKEKSYTFRSIRFVNKNK